MVHFLRSARRRPGAPKSDDGNRLHDERVRPSCRRLRMGPATHPSLRFCPGRQRRSRVGTEVVAPLATATAIGQHPGSVVRLGRDRRWSLALIPYSFDSVHNARSGVSSPAARRSIPPKGRSSSFPKRLYEGHRCREKWRGHASLKG